MIGKDLCLLLAFLHTAVGQGPVWPIPSGLWQPAVSLPSQVNYLYIQYRPYSWSEWGNFTYIQANSSLLITLNGFLLNATAVGFETWTGYLAGSDARLEPGFYGNASQYPSNSALSTGQISWFIGTEYECAPFDSWFAVQNISYNGTELIYIEVQFEQVCETTTTRGALRWSNQDHSEPAGPITPPAHLWKPPASVLPPSSNYAYLEVPKPAANYTYSSSTAVIRCSSVGNQISAEVKGNQRWVAVFQAMSSVPRLVPGYYSGQLQFPDPNPAFGGFMWAEDFSEYYSSENGWFLVEEVEYEGEAVRKFKVRFYQVLIGGPSLYGALYYDREHKDSPPEPVYPPPKSLWRPETAALPSTGNYLYMETNSTRVHNTTFTHFNSIIALNSSANRLSLQVFANVEWRGAFVGRHHAKQLHKGYYSGLISEPYNELLGGVAWESKALQLEPLNGWFAIDEISYLQDNATLEAVKLRFEVVSETDSPPILCRGALSWSLSNPTNLVPLYPAPALWSPPTPLPQGVNSAYIECPTANYTYTSLNATFQTTQSGGVLTARIYGSEHWTGYFKAMAGLAALEVGYYGLLPRYRCGDERLAALQWHDQKCHNSESWGWFVIDAVTYVAGEMTTVQLRFEVTGMFDESGDYFVTYRGALNWAATAADLLFSGNSVYLENPAGRVYASSVQVEVTKDCELTVAVEGWKGSFQACGLTAGHYELPAKGLRECEQGWFVVEKAVYEAGQVMEVRGRFEQQCRLTTVGGVIAWSRGAASFLQ